MPEDDQSNDNSIAKLAYQLWESRGRPTGTAEANWLEAEAMLVAGGAGSAMQAANVMEISGKLVTERRKSRARKTSTASREA